MVLSNELTKKLGIRYPVIQGPFGGGLSSIELLTTVSNLGGLGSYGAHHLPPKAISQLITDIRAQTSEPFAINLWVSSRDHFIDGVSRRDFDEYSRRFEPLYAAVDAELPEFTETFSHDFDQQVEAAIDARAPVLSFVFGVPGPQIIKKCRDNGIVTIGTATTVDEAILLQTSGVDIVVATGFEAGGHRVSFLKEPEDCLTGTFALIPQVADSLTVPIVAAGAIADARGVRAAMALGAQGVQVGTAFLAANQSGTSVKHRDILFSDRARHTVLSRAFTGRLARFIENETINFVEKTEGLPLRFPLQSYFTGPIKAAAAKHNNNDFASLYAGQGAPLLKHHEAEQMFNSLIVDFT